MRGLLTTNFRYLASGRLLVTLAMQLQAVVLGWQVYEIKKDPLYLGLIGLAEAVPAITLAIFGGHFVDRGQPIRIYRHTIFVAMLSSLALLVFCGGIAEVAPDAKVAVIFGAVVLTGVIRAFAWPAMFAITPQVVERARFAEAQTWLSAIFQVGAITGPALGGLAYGWKGPGAAYAVICVLMVLTAVTTQLLQVPRIDRGVGIGKKEPLLTSLSSGARFVFGNQVVLGALALDMFAVLFGGATALLPIFAGEILKSGPESLGILRASPAVGALLMSLVMMRRPVGRAAGAILLWAVAVFGVCMVGFGLSTSLGLSVALLGLSGAFDAVSVVIRHTILQLWTPDEMRGRVSAVNMIFIGSSNEIGEFESGVAARLLGTVPSVVFGGCMTLLIVAATAILAPKLRELELPGGKT